MKKIILCFALCSCGPVVKQTPPDPIPVKPFYVYDKWSYHKDPMNAHYSCVDANGYRFDFWDMIEKYSVGDTIK